MSKIPEYVENLEEATRIARSALPLAGQLSIPLNPINYAVLYEHVAGLNPKLSEALNKLKTVAAGCTDANLRELYLHFVCQSDEQAVESMRNVLDSIVSSALGSIERVSDESQEYKQTLGSAASQLSDNNLVLSREITQKLIEATEKMQATTQTLQEELREANAELDQIRSEFKRVRRESLSDPLTGIKNRRSFDIAMEEILPKMNANPENLCLAILDLDHFKHINDTFGHVTGDAVLKWVSKLMSDSVRGCDILARYGGEEFVLLLPETNITGATFLAEKIRRKMAEQKLEMQHKPIGVITASFGVASYQMNESADSFIARADQALYRAKNSGRNKVVVYK